MLGLFIIFPKFYIPIRAKGQPKAEAEKQKPKHQVNPAESIGQKIENNSN